jgi:2-polyprenyl-3-methyl-5-hydroxy-6-metoxy-1,4-benzoquinol methylase
VAGYHYEAAARAEVAAFLPQTYKTVLEVGCGRGGFAINLKKEAEIWGVEPNPKAAQEARSKGYQTCIGTYDEVAHLLKDKYFDLVVCNDVIEHMPDHDLFLQKIKKKLAPKGCIVGSIPNVRFYQNMYDLIVKRNWEYTDQGILDRTHLRFFTEKSLIRTMQSNGYTIEAFSGIDDITLHTKKRLKYFAFTIARVITLGNFSDMRFMRFGFRISPLIS